MEEKVIEIKNCRFCSTSFGITDKDLEFYEKVSPVFNGVKYNIPSPTLCPECREQRRLLWRNERNLYKRKCDATGKNIISIYSPDKNYKVYTTDEWYSDKWDAISYGREYDFSKSFFEQFKELQYEIPRIQNFVAQNENSDYTNGSAYNKDCYMIFVSDHNENCSYCEDILSCTNSVDCSDGKNNVSCYEVTGCSNCYEGKYCVDCFDSRNISFCFDCKNCENCFLSVGLRNKKYVFENKELSKEEYFKKIKEYENLSKKQVKYLLDSLFEKKKDFGHLSFHGVGNIDSVGDYITNCKNSKNVFSSHQLEDCKYLVVGNEGKDCQDGYVVVDNSSLAYESVGVIGLVHSAFIYACWNGNNEIYYCDSCQSSKNLFGCIGLRNKEYCILNKQYTKEEYETLVPRIIEQMKTPFIKGGQSEALGGLGGFEWGEFFPAYCSPFGYNETVANEYFPLGKQQIINKGYNWSTYENPKPDVSKIIPAIKLPESIKDIPDDIINWAIECEITGKPFRIIKTELDFYKKYSLPIPSRHPEQRHLDRMKLKNPRKLFDRNCFNCKISIKTTYSPDREEMVYCEECYNKAII